MQSHVMQCTAAAASAAATVRQALAATNASLAARVSFSTAPAPTPILPAAHALALRLDLPRPLPAAPSRLGHAAPRLLRALLPTPGSRNPVLVFRRPAAAGPLSLAPLFLLRLLRLRLRAGADLLRAVPAGNSWQRRGGFGEYDAASNEDACG